MLALHFVPPLTSTPVRHQSGIVAAFDRAALAATMLEQGEGLLARDALEDAAARFQTAAHAFEALGDAAGCA